MRQILLVCLVGILLSSQALAGKPQCYLHGVMRSKVGKKSELSDMLRLHFDAADKEQCIRLVNSYCRYNVRDEGYSPRDLEAYFKPDGDKSEKFVFKFAENCKVSPTEDE